jgi:hypothetical protein
MLLDQPPSSITFLVVGGSPCHPPLAQMTASNRGSPRRMLCTPCSSRTVKSVKHSSSSQSGGAKGIKSVSSQPLLLKSFGNSITSAFDSSKQQEEIKMRQWNPTGSGPTSRFRQSHGPERTNQSKHL